MDKRSVSEFIKKIFYEIVDDAQFGITLNISEDEYSYVRFNYIENGILYGENTDEEYFGNPNKYNEIYEAEYSNGTINYLPSLKVYDENLFFSTLEKLINKYMNSYNFSNAINRFGKKNIIKNIILTIFSNARYIDYENPILYLNRYIEFFNDQNKLDNYITDIYLLEHSDIITKTKKEEYGYETPYYFETSLIKENQIYYLPNINYGISDDTCYIYSIQNKFQNQDTDFNKKIKRNINKINGGVIDNTDYDRQDTILGVPPSFVLVLTIFLKTLKNNGINNVEIITFLPDRYFEKKASEEYDADLIQNNLTQRLVLLAYRIQEQINDIEINYPIYDSISYNEKGDNLLIRLGDNMQCNNNKLIEEVLFKMSNSINKKL